MIYPVIDNKKERKVRRRGTAAPGVTVKIENCSRVDVPLRGRDVKTRMSALPAFSPCRRSCPRTRMFGFHRGA